ncbi:MAG: PEP-CTERM sorting domain-containing protein [Phycisphaerales bacterium]
MSVQNNFKLGALTVAATGLLMAAPASADVILSFGYTDLDGDYDAASRTFTAVATDNVAAGLRSAGDVTRQVDPIGTAEFNTGFVGGATLANFVLSMTLSNVTATSADVLAGDASFTITDDDGDTIDGGIIGSWIEGPNGFLFFNGVLQDVVLTDNGNQDGTFDGSSFGAFSMDFNGSNGPFDGAIVTLSINSSGEFFLESFNNASTLVSAEIVPAPATLAMLGVGGFMAGSRRRRRA